MVPIEFVDLKIQQQRILPELERRIKGVLCHGRYILGPEVAELEERLAAYAGTRHCVAVSSGTDALLIALMAAGIGAGDEVVTTPFTFIATGEVIALLGATPVFVDIDPATLNLDPGRLEEAITPKTKAILPVSLYGRCPDFQAIEQLLERHNRGRREPILVVEDACQSFGASHRGRKSCSLSAVGCTSFFPSKPLGCYGDGGACFTSDDRLAELMRGIRAHGQKRRYHHELLGVNGRMDTLQAAVLLAKLELFEEEVELRGQVAARYCQMLEKVVTTPPSDPHGRCVWAQFTVQLDARERVQQKLKEQGIPTAVHYPVPLHLQPVFAYLQKPAGSFPVAERAAGRVLSLPMHPYLQEPEIERICRALADAIAS